MPIESLSDAFDKNITAPVEFDSKTMQKFLDSKKGQGCLRGEWTHGKSVSSAYWDPRGRSVVSTSYDDTLRCGSQVSLTVILAVFIERLLIVIAIM